jgi:hypothetical protein
MAVTLMLDCSLALPSAPERLSEPQKSSWKQ